MTNTTRSKEDLKALKVIDEIISNFRAAVSPVATLSIAHTFLAVAQNEGKSLTEIAQITSNAIPTTSRNLLDLGERNRKKEEGFKLVKSEQNPLNLRENMYTLTPRGRLLADRLIKIINNG